MDGVPRLLEETAEKDPFTQFGRWFGEAVSAGERQPEAMALATATPDGRPSVRLVLLKRFDDRGLVFYTNYDSDKGRDLTANPRAAAVLHWPLLHRQVRVAGAVSRLSREDSEAYFETRPYGARISAAASPQSRPVSLAELEERVARVRAAHPERVPLPGGWGGYLIRPDRFEFWQGRDARLHDRLRYERQDGTWTITRLGP